MITRFAHVRATDSKEKSYTIAFTEIPRGTSGEVHYAKAYCSPRDNFNKKIGRSVAEGRLAKGIYSTVMVESSQFSDIVAKIVENER